MAKYLEVKFTANFKEENSFISDLLSNDLVEIGFDSFTQEESCLLAYVPESLYDKDNISNIIKSNPLYSDVSFSVQEMEDKDWNEEWEKNYFQPIVIADKCVICSAFHKNVPEAEYKIIINPRMAFGTGHHQTTELMIRHIAENDFQGKKVMDMGCGTAILSIFAALRGAQKVDAVDIDEWAYENSIDNLRENGVEDIISVRQGDASSVSGIKEEYDIFLANINKNILLADVPAYAPSIKKGGLLFLSGFYKADIPDIQKVAEEHGFSLVSFKEKDNWVALCLNKC